MSAARGRKPSAEPWYAAEGLKFTCTQCGECCRGPDPGYVEVDEPMIDRLAEHLGLAPEAFSRRYVRWMSSLGVYSLTEKKNGDCVFWSDDSGCTVYTVRPTQCRTFPFWPETIDSQESWDAYAADCPGMTRGKAGAGKRYLKDEIEALSSGQGETGTSRARRLRRAEDPAGDSNHLDSNRRATS